MPESIVEQELAVRLAFPLAATPGNLPVAGLVPQSTGTGLEIAWIATPGSGILWGGFVSHASWPAANATLPTFFWDTDSDNLMVKKPVSQGSQVYEISNTLNPIQ